MHTERVACATPLALSVAGAGPLVILIHGMGGDRSTWHAQIEALSDAYTAVAVDLRGYGDSAEATSPLDFKRDFTDDLLAVMAHFDVARAHLVGLSMGGRVARTASLRAPHRIASLTLANTSPGFDAMAVADMERFIAERSSGISPHALPPRFGLRQSHGMMAPGASGAALRTAARAMQRVRPGHYLQVLAASTLQDRGDRLEDIGCPTLVISGDGDPVYPAAITRQLTERIPGARHVLIENAGHLSNLEQPQAFNRALRAFLDSLPPEPAARPHRR